MRKRDPVLQALISRYSLKGVATAIGITDAAVCHWRRIPAKHVPALSLHFRIARWRLRPDLWPPPSRDRKAPPEPGDPAMEAAA